MSRTSYDCWEDFCGVEQHLQDAALNHLFKIGTSCEVGTGSGKSVIFWEDRWVNGMVLKESNRLLGWQRANMEF